MIAQLKTLLASRAISLLIALALLMIYFWNDIADPGMLLDRTRHLVEIGLVAIPMTFIIASGGIDLSVGALMALSGIVGAYCAHVLGWPFTFAMTMCVGIGALGGILNGLVISLLRLPALVVTLATMALFQGLSMGVSKGNAIGGFPAEFCRWGTSAAVTIGSFEIPQQALILIGFFIFGMFLFHKTVAGRWAVQIGENTIASRFSAVPVNSVQFWMYTLTGIVCGIASILYLARFSTAHPSEAVGKELEIITCVVIGGTRMIGGSGTAIGTFLGLLVYSVLRFGLDMQGKLSQHQQLVLIGLLLIVTAVFNEWMAKRSERQGARLSRIA